MAGRGGRGAAILEALQARQRQPGEQVQQGDEFQEAPPIVHGGRGRSSLLASLRMQSETSASASPPVQTVMEPLMPQGRGRASLLQTLSLGRDTSISTSSESSVSVSCKSETEPPIQQMKQMSFQEKPPVHRTGESGHKISATANYIRLVIEPGKGVYEYEVRYNPDLDSRGMRIKLLNEHIKELGGTKTFDGTTLYLPIKLKEQVSNYTSSHPIDGSSITMTITFKKQKCLGECIHLYNVLFRRIMSALDLARIGRQHFMPQNAHPIPQHKLEVWPGYVTAVDEYEGGIQLCCDASHRVLRTQTVHDLMQEIVSRNPGNFRDIVQKTIIGASVLTRYNNKMYRVDDIHWQKNPLSTFMDQFEKKDITFVQYYKKQHNLDIKDIQQPLLVNRMKKKIRGQDEVEMMICLVPELCFMTGLTDEMRNDIHVMKDIAMYTRITPNQRQLSLRKFVVGIQKNERAQELLASWGLHLEPTTVNLEARVLDAENIEFGNGIQIQGSKQADWGMASSRNKVLCAVDLNSWLIVHSHRDGRVAQEFSGMLRKIAPPMGIYVNEPQIAPLRDDRIDSYLRILRENINPRLQLVVIIFPTARNDRYGAVKKLCCSEMPVASQVINSRTLSRPDRVRSVVQKIALQINCKLGGTLWSVKIPMGKLMVCGIDSYHDATMKGSSVAGFVASTNPVLTQWFSKVSIQGKGQELVDSLKLCFIAALKKYYEINHAYPERIVIYRDGVGDGQLRVSSEYEVPQFESCFQHINDDYHPKLTVIVCQKRINTRIFAVMGRGGDGNLENPGPGTIVDHTITRRNWFDFFLVSQHVRQGTVTPTHYVVIHDNSNMKTDHIQRLTYKLCHLYYNWPGTIRVPAPCQYAHKLAQLVGQSINRVPSEKLSDRLYFL